jgi:hypothetical protein
MDYVTGPGQWEQISNVLVGGAGFVVLDLSSVSFAIRPG